LVLSINDTKISGVVVIFGEFSYFLISLTKRRNVDWMPLLGCCCGRVM